MDKEQFIHILASDARDYSNRPLLTQTVLEHRTWVSILLDNMRCVEDENSNFSARVLELACKKELSVIIPYLNTFGGLLSKLQFDGSCRASAKIIEMLCVQYFIKINPNYIDTLNHELFEQFTERCFDWMITNRAIAIQAHSMYSLYLMGLEFDWIHAELFLQIERNLPHGSIGYQNRGRKIIRAISTQKLLKLQAQ